MADAGVVYGDKAFFTDDRDPERRLSVSSHPEAGVVVLALWEGDKCRATFRLRIEEAPGLINVLSEAFGAPVEPDPPLRRVK